jgi:hypothetical protein
MRQPTGQVMHEVVCRASVTAADKPARHKFRVRVKRNPSPNTANAGHVPHFIRQVFVFGVTEAPNFVAMNPLALKIAEYLVLIGRTGRAKLHQQLLNRPAMRAGHARGGTKRVALDQTGNHFDLFFGAQFIHAYNMLERSSNVNSFCCFWINLRVKVIHRMTFFLHWN